MPPWERGAVERATSAHLLKFGEEGMRWRLGLDEPAVVEPNLRLGEADDPLLVWRDAIVARQFASKSFEDVGEGYLQHAGHKRGSTRARVLNRV